MDTNMKKAFSEQDEVEYEGGENETIEEDEDFGKFHGEKIVPVGMSSGVSMDDLKRQWMSDMKMDFEGDVMSLDDGPVGYAPYRMAWNGNQLHPVDCINVLHSLIGDDLNVELSSRSMMFECNGITERDLNGNEKKLDRTKLGGGCIVFIRRRRQVAIGKRIRYVFDSEGVALKLVADLHPAPLAGIHGKKLGDLVCADMYTKTFEPKRRNAELSFALRKSLGIAGLRMEVKYLGGSLGLYTAEGPGTGQLRAAANRKLKNGVTVMYDGFNRVFKTAGGMVPSPAVMRAKNAERKQSLQESMRSTAGRRVKVWKLKAEAVEVAVQAKVKEVLETFGAVESCDIRVSNDQCSWMVAVFEASEAAVLACTDDALGDALTEEDLADPGEGFCRSELCNAENTEADIARMNKGAAGEGAKVQELGSLQRTFAHVAGGTDADALMARLLHGEKTTRELMSQVVEPTVRSVKKELMKAGKRVVAAVKTGVKDELKDVKDDVAEIKELLQNLTELDGTGMRKKAPLRKAKKTLAKVDSPAPTPRSAVKAVRKRSGSNAGLLTSASAQAAAVMERLVGQLYARKDGSALVAQLMDENDLEVLTKKFKKRGSSDDDDEEDDDDDDEEMEEEEDDEDEENTD